MAEGERVIEPASWLQLMRRRPHARRRERTVETHVTQIFAELDLLEELDMNNRVLAILAALNRSET